MGDDQGVELYERKAVPVDLNAGRKLLFLGLRAVDQKGTHDSRLPNFGTTTTASLARSATAAQTPILRRSCVNDQPVWKLQPSGAPEEKLLEKPPAKTGGRGLTDRLGWREMMQVRR